MAQSRKGRDPRGAESDSDRLLDRPLTPRSLVASLLLGSHPPRLPGALLVQWCGLFGVAEGTTRVALSRMVDRGELEADHGAYALAGDVRARQAPQDWSVRPRTTEPWSGEWRIAVVHPVARRAQDRAHLRAAARRLRMVEMREGVWIRPDNLPVDADPVDARHALEQQTQRFVGRLESDAGALVARFDADAWAARARRLATRVEQARRRVRSSAPGSFPEAFETGAAALQHIRADPLLPDDLLGDGWPGPALRDAYLEYQPAFAAAVAGWFRELRPDALGSGSR